MTTKKRCPFPGKQQHTREAAQDRARRLRGNASLGYINAYRCPAGGHWHVGHPPRGRKRRRY